MSLEAPEEVSVMSTAFRRWQDWAVIAIGVVVFATPFVSGETSNGNSTNSAYVLGALVAGAGLLAAFMESQSRFVAWIVAALGVILFFTPWLFGFTAVTGVAWVSWIAGALAVGVSGTELLIENPQKTVAA
jgi:SPW repeat